MAYEVGKSYPLPKPDITPRMRDVVPNGDDFRTRIYGAHLRNNHDRDALGYVAPPAGNTSAMWVGIAIEKVSCPQCCADVGEPCHGLKDKVHSKRFSMAKRVFGRKSPEQSA